MNRILDSSTSINLSFSVLGVTSTLNSEAVKQFYLVFSVIITCIFSILYVRWLWNAQRIAYKVFLISSFVRFSAPLFFVMLLFLAAVGVAAIVFDVSISLVLYGNILTALWPFVVLVTLWAG